jgi:prevent-host-death family protein
MAMGKMIGAAEFKAHCLRILDEVERTGESVTITKRGRAVAEVKPVAEKAAGDRSRLEFGFMKGSITFLTDDEVFSPLDPDWEEQWEKKWDDRGFAKR